MALMSQQAVTFPAITPSYAAPTVSDTITPDSGLVLYVKNGATSSTVTVVVPGNQEFSGIAKTDVVVTFSNGERAIPISPSMADPSTGLISVTYSSVATVTVALLKF